MSAIEITIADIYEKTTGLAFCREDLPFLQLSLQRVQYHNQVAKAISFCSKWPDDDPGKYLRQRGFEQILRFIQASPRMQKKSKVSRTGVKTDVPRIQQRQRRLAEQRELKEAEKRRQKAELAKKKEIESGGSQAIEAMKKTDAEISRVKVGGSIPELGIPLPPAPSPDEVLL